MSTTVEVNATAVTLDTNTSALSQLFSQKQVEELPLNGRNFLQLLLIGAGAVTVGGEAGQMRQGQGNASAYRRLGPRAITHTGWIDQYQDTALGYPGVISPRTQSRNSR